MLMSMISHLLWLRSLPIPLITSPLIAQFSAWFAFLLPSYSTYKALSSPLSGELQNLSMYWAVIGAFIAAETTIGPFVSWLVILLPVSTLLTPIFMTCRLPFYWEIRTLFLLYISLPQIQVRIHM